MNERKTKTTENKEVRNETLVYLGPTIVGVVTQNTFFNNGLSDELENVIKEMPVINNLIVPLSKYTKASSEINKNEGAMYEFYKKALQYRLRKEVGTNVL